MMDLSELFAQSARELLPQARVKQLVSYFDYDGPELQVQGEDDALRGAIHRLLLGVTDCIDTGFLVFTAAASPPHQGRSDVVVHAAASGPSVSSERVAQVCRRLRLQPLDEAPDPGAGLAGRAIRRWGGRCPVTGGEVRCTDEAGQGVALSLQVQVPAIAAAAPRAPSDAAGVTAWLVSDIAGGLDSVALRLERLGWQVRRFDSLPQVSLALEAISQRDARPPMLLVVAESAGSALGDMEPLTVDGPGMWPILAVLAGSPTIRSREHTPVDIRILPLSPQELARFTEHVDRRTSTEASRQSAPSPSYVQESRRVLVVDDSEVNRMIARGQLEMLGYEVAVASQGLEALLHCREHAPHVVLMDLDMPVMGGLEATRQLRRWQEAGTVPPFAIVAATGVDNPQRRQECGQAGMDGFLVKPLALVALAEEMRRLVPARPA